MISHNRIARSLMVPVLLLIAVGVTKSPPSPASSMQRRASLRTSPLVPLTKVSVFTPPRSEMTLLMRSRTRAGVKLPSGPIQSSPVASRSSTIGRILPQM